MYVRNLLRAGDYVELSPIGIPITLIYNHHLDRVKLGFDDNSEDITDQVIQIFRDRSVVPFKIPIVQGTTWIKGVLYCSDFGKFEGSVPDAVQSQLLNKFLLDPSSFNFFAGHVKSLGTVFRGALPIRQWLQTYKFNILPGLIVPSNLTKQSFYSLVSKMNYPFRFPLVANYMVFHKDDFSIYSTGLKSYICESAASYVDENGYLHGRIQCKFNTLNVDYRDIVKYNIQKNSLLIQDMYGATIFSDNASDRSQISNAVVCPICGKVYNIDFNREPCCDDIHCLSHSYSRIRQFTSVLKLPCLPFDEFNRYVKNKNITTFTDLFLVDPLQSIEIKCTLAKFMRAIIPEYVVHNFDSLQALCNKCNNSWDVLQYYIRNPERITYEFLTNSYDGQQLVSYLKDKGVVLEITTLAESSQITFVDSDRTFDGPPIFRGKTILLTGKFRHGSYGQVASILQSYDAKIVYAFDESVSAVIVGDIKENVNGTILRNCRMLNIPVYDEQLFFDQYEIDSDIKANLS